MSEIGICIDGKLQFRPVVHVDIITQKFKLEVK